MSTGLPVSRLINVGVSLQSAGAQFANLSSALILGDSDVIDTQQRIRSYASPGAIATDFGSTAPEYLAAVDFFAQKPQPTQVYVGKWASAATAGRLIGAALTTAQQALATFTAITNGSLKIAIDGAAAAQVTSLNFSGATNLNGVASIITTALTGATCVWTGSQFVIKSSTTGATSAVAFPVTATGADIKATLGLTAALGARSVAGIVAESALAAVQALDALPTFWYGLMLASPAVQDSDRQAIAAFIEADSNGPHLFGVTGQAAAIPDATQTTDIASVLTAAGYQRTFGLYSSSDPYAVASMFGRLLTVDYNGENTTINMMYQQLPGITPESLSLPQANAMDAKRINYCANYNNGVAVLQNGECFGPAYIDEIAGTDWLANYVQVNLFNLLSTMGTKIPQTDDGIHLLVTNANKSLAQAVRNGLLAPGVWNQGGFGQLKQGDFMPTGFYVYAAPIAQQATADRAARKAPLLQIAAKLAGAVNTASALISVNR